MIHDSKQRNTNVILGFLRELHRAHHSVNGNLCMSQMCCEISPFILSVTETQLASELSWSLTVSCREVLPSLETLFHGCGGYMKAAFWI